MNKRQRKKQDRMIKRRRLKLQFHTIMLLKELYEDLDLGEIIPTFNPLLLYQNPYEPVPLIMTLKEFEE